MGAIMAQGPPGVVRKAYTHGNGRPGCRTAIEQQAPSIRWRNNWDPIRYWQCANGVAVSYICPIEYMFSYDDQCCLRWNYWVWTPPFDPPSMPQ